MYVIILFYQVNATEGDGGGVIYSLVAGDLSKFTIDSVTGLITTLESLDREDQNRYILTVQARDTPGSNALSSFAQVFQDKLSTKKSGSCPYWSGSVWPQPPLMQPSFSTTQAIFTATHILLYSHLE